MKNGKWFLKATTRSLAASGRCLVSASSEFSNSLLAEPSGSSPGLLLMPERNRFGLTFSTRQFTFDGALGA